MYVNPVGVKNHSNLNLTQPDSRVAGNPDPSFHQCRPHYRRLKRPHYQFDQLNGQHKIWSHDLVIFEFFFFFCVVVGPFILACPRKIYVPFMLGAL